MTPSTRCVTFDVISCQIRLADNTFDSQQVMRGTFKLDVNKQTVITSIYAELIGVCKCSWVCKKQCALLPILSGGPDVRWFVGSEEFLRLRHTFLDNNATVYERGDYKYDFKFLLKDCLPGTWRGVHGSISYRVRVHIQQSESVEHTFDQPVSVVARRDLTLEPRLRTPARSDASRRFRNALVSLGGRVRVTVWLPICGIVPGQGIPVLCRIVNDSKIAITGLLFVLTKIETYRCQEPIKNVLHTRVDVCRVARTVNVDRERYVHFCVVGTPNDLACTSESIGCQICQVTYELWVSAQSGLPRNSAYGYPNIDTPGIPIIVGTVPLETWNVNSMTEEVQEYIRRSNDDDFKTENSIRPSSEMVALT